MTWGRQKFIKTSKTLHERKKKETNRVPLILKSSALKKTSLRERQDKLNAGKTYFPHIYI